MVKKIKKIKKRNGEIVVFDENKVIEAIFKALTAADEGDRQKAKFLAAKVVAILERRNGGEIPSVEEIQDIAKICALRQRIRLIVDMQKIIEKELVDKLK